MSLESSTARIELRLLGGFGLTVGGEPVEMTPAAQRLLAFVALTPRGAERSYTAFQLWPEHDERRAKGNLRSALWRLGKAPAVLVTATKSHLRLGPAVWVDARHGVDELASGGLDSIVRASLPFQALDSDLLPDWYDDWLMIERERLRQFRLGSLEEGARLALERDDLPQAIQLGLAAISIDPLRESGHRLVIEAHLANGNHHDAVRQYQYCAQLLASRVGQPPSARLTSLIGGLIDGPVGTIQPALVAV